MSQSPAASVLVTGATGFIGSALVTELCGQGLGVVAASRRSPPPTKAPGARACCPEWRVCDLLRPETLPAALAGVRVAYYLVHSMGGSHGDFQDVERRTAETFARAAEAAKLERIVYLGGPAPSGAPSPHLASRLAVGEILRGGSVPCVELRASMVVGAGSASWQIVRDLAVRLPFMVLPRWLKSRTRPVALDDVIGALVSAGTMPLASSAWFDLPGPEAMSGRQILERIARLRGRRIRAVEVPLLTPELSALWLKLITRTDFALARELVLGLTDDLLGAEGGFWELTQHPELLSFDQAAKRALDCER